MEPEQMLQAPPPADFMPEPIQVSAQNVVEPTPIQVSDGVSKPKPPAEVAEERSNKFSIAFPKSPFNQKTALDFILDNRENDLRRSAAAQVDMDNSMLQQQTINAIAAKQGKPISYLDSLMLKDIIQRKQADPNSVIEEGYAQKFMESLYKTAEDNPNGLVAEALKNSPEVVTNTVKKGQDYKTKQELVLSWLQDADTTYKSQSLVGWTADMLKSLTAVYGETKLRGLMGDTRFWEGGLGTNIRKQWADLFAMPVEQFKTIGEPIARKLIKDNPGLALLWLSAGNGLSKEDEFLINAFPVLDIVAGAEAGVKGAAAIARLRDASRILKAAQSLIKNEESKVTKASISEAAGNIPQAAAEHFAQQVSDQFTQQGTVKSKAVDDLVDIFGRNVDALKTEPPKEKVIPSEPPLEPPTKYGALLDKEFPVVPETAGKTVGLSTEPSTPMFRTELVNRIREQMINSYDKFITAVGNVMKIEQLPSVLALQRVSKQLARDMAGEYPGLDNNLFNVKLRRDNATGQWFADYYFIHNNGRMFGSEREAINFAEKANLGEVFVLPAEGPGKPWKVINNTGKPSFVKGGVEHLDRDVRDVFTGELDDAELKAITTGKDTYNKGVLYKDLGHTMEIDDRIPLEYNIIEQKGTGYYIHKTKPVPINADFTRDLMLETAETRTPNKLINAFDGILGSLRTPEDILSVENIINRKIAALGPAILYDVFKENAAAIQKLKGLPGSAKGKVWKEWKDVMSWLDNVPNPRTGEKGADKAFSTPGELADLYMQRTSRPPSEAELAASFAYRNQIMMAEQLERLNVLKSDLRQGATYWTLDAAVPTSNKATSAPARKASFKAVGMRDLPTSGTVFVMRPGEDWGVGSVYNNAFKDASTFATSALGKDLREQVMNGTLKVVRLLEPDLNPLSGMFDPGRTVRGPEGSKQALDNVRITHVISPNLSDKALSLDHIKINKPNNLDFDHYVVQPIVKFNPITSVYEYIGDRSIAAFNINKQGAEVAEHLNAIKNLIKEGKETEAKTFYNSVAKLPMSYDDIRAWFEPELTTEGLTISSKLNLNETIRVVPANKLSVDVSNELTTKYSNFADRTRETYGQYKIYPQNDVLWNVTPTKYIDPMTSINRSLIRTINDNYLNDYKVFSVEHWIQEAKGLMRDPDRVGSAPMYFFHNPDWLPGLTGQQAIQRDNLMSAQMQIKQFLGVRDANTTFLHNAAQILADSIYTKFGEKKVLLTVADKLPLLRDPFQFIRSVTFNAKVGLFSPAQLLVQLQTFSTIAGIAGWDKAAAGASATLLHTWSRINRSPEIMKALDGYMTKLGFRPGEFLEAHELLSNNGFENVGGAHIYRDSTTFNDLIQGPGATFLNAGQYFFREGDRAGKVGAFYTAYKEFRDANPTKKLTEVDKRFILNRADLLNNNMTRASASTLQKGVWSIPFQFITYQTHLLEMMMGTRLTSVEKGRLFGTYAMMYGVPAAFGSFTMGIGNDLIMQDAVAKGYIAGSDENYKINTAITEGLPSLVLQMMTGNTYNVGERFAGSSGPVTDFLRGDKHIWEILGGAAGSTIYRSIIGMDGFATAMWAGITNSGPMMLKSEDFVEPFKQISAFNSSWKLGAALSTGKWLSTKEVDLGDVSPLNALFMAATGLGPQSSTESGQIFAVKESEKAKQSYALQTFIKEVHRGLRAFDQGNPEQGNDYMKRGFRVLQVANYPEDKIAAAIAIASEDVTDLISRVRLDFYSKNVPMNRQKDADEAMLKFMRMQQQGK